MNIEEYREYCLSLGDVEEKIPFSAFHNAESEILAFYVGGHIFALFYLNDFDTITLKCQTDTIEELKSSSRFVTKPMSRTYRIFMGFSLYTSRPLYTIKACPLLPGIEALRLPTKLISDVHAISMDNHNYRFVWIMEISQVSIPS